MTIELKNQEQKLYQITKSTIIVYSLTSILASIITIFFVYHSENKTVLPMQFLLIVISSFFLFLCLINKITTRTKYFVSLFYLAVFMIMWRLLSYQHPMVIIYAINVAVLSFLIHFKKHRHLFMMLISLAYLYTIYYDLFLRTEHFSVESHIYQRYTSVLIVIFCLLMTIYINRLALENAVEELDYNSHRDHLTQIKNIRSFEEDLKKLTELYTRYGENFFLVYMDLDKFKLINDTYGHDIGDQVLKSAAHMFKTQLRSTDDIYRIGGDEFILIMKGISEESIVSAIDRMLNSQHDYMSFDFDIHLSYGICSMAQAHKLGMDIIKCADEKMYQQKINKSTL